jgi:arsenate reductase
MQNLTKVLFLCDGNDVRSQIAEGLLRRLGGEKFDVHSASLEPAPLDTYAVAVMNEINIDISDHNSHHLNDYLDDKFDYVITLCDEVKSSCLAFLHDAQTLHWHCPNPKNIGDNDSDRRLAFRQTRDRLHKQIVGWLESLDEAN